MCEFSKVKIGQQKIVERKENIRSVKVWNMARRYRNVEDILCGYAAYMILLWEKVK